MLLYQKYFEIFRFERIASYVPIIISLAIITYLTLNYVLKITSSYYLKVKFYTSPRLQKFISAIHLWLRMESFVCNICYILNELFSKSLSSNLGNTFFETKKHTWRFDFFAWRFIKIFVINIYAIHKHEIKRMYKCKDNLKIQQLFQQFYQSLDMLKIFKIKTSNFSKIRYLECYLNINPY